MNYTALATLALIVGGTLAPPATLSEPGIDGPRLATGSPVRATVDPHRPIVVQLANETDRLLDYAPANDQPRSLPPGATGQLFLKVGPRRGDTGSILINTPNWTNPIPTDLSRSRSNSRQARNAALRRKLHRSPRRSRLPPKSHDWGRMTGVA